MGEMLSLILIEFNYFKYSGTSIFVWLWLLKDFRGKKQRGHSLSSLLEITECINEYKNTNGRIWPNFC